jgi:putative hydrolase of the HAD superfamily
MNSTEKIILCDLGGVLIELNWISAARKLFGADLNPDELLHKWLSMSSIKKFEAGKCDFAEFFADFCEETGNRLKFSDFAQEFGNIIGPVKKGCFEILPRLKESGTLAMLSNTNQIHIDMLRKETDLLDHFEQLFLSYEMHLVKPDPEIFAAVAAKLRVAPEKIMFFDDSATNVNAAKNMGFSAFRVTSPQEILQIVESVESH